MRCVHCNKEKSMPEFVKDSRKKSGRRRICKECNRLRYKKYSDKLVNQRENNKINKYCSRCDRNRNVKYFYKNRRGKQGLHTYCKDCHKQYTKEHQNSEKTRRYRIKSVYGITIEEYDSMFETQRGLCAICNSNNPVSKYNKFNVDHDHKTGKIRALLCSHCNRALGMMNDNPELLIKAAEYIRAFQEVE